MLHLRGRVHYADIVERLIRPCPQIEFAYGVANPENGGLAKRSEMQYDILKMKPTEEAR